MNRTACLSLLIAWSAWAALPLPSSAAEASPAPPPRAVKILFGSVGPGGEVALTQEIAAFSLVEAFSTRLEKLPLEPTNTVGLVEPALVLLAGDGTALRAFRVRMAKARGTPNGYRGLCLSECAITLSNGRYLLGQPMAGYDSKTMPGRPLPRVLQTPWLFELLGIRYTFDL